jgi:peptidoglycan/LPS O-acetylase OafA/YrhL
MLPGVLGAPYIDGVYWTLFVEFKFYALVFLILATSTFHHLERWLALWLAISAATAIGAAPHWLASVSLAPFGPYFLIGCFLFVLREHGPSAPRLGALVASVALAARDAVGQQAGFLAVVTPASQRVAVGVVVGGAALLALVALRPSTRTERVSYLLGTLTYPLYLLHAQIGSTLWRLLSKQFTEWPALGIELAVVVALTALVAAVTERRACGALQRALTRRVARIPQWLVKWPKAAWWVTAWARRHERPARESGPAP